MSFSYQDSFNTSNNQFTGDSRQAASSYSSERPTDGYNYNTAGYGYGQADNASANTGPAGSGAQNSSTAANLLMQVVNMLKSDGTPADQSATSAYPTQHTGADSSNYGYGQTSQYGQTEQYSQYGTQQQQPQQQEQFTQSGQYGTQQGQYGQQQSSFGQSQQNQQQVQQQVQQQQQDYGASSFSSGPSDRESPSRGGRGAIRGMGGGNGGSGGGRVGVGGRGGGPGRGAGGRGGPGRGKSGWWGPPGGQGGWANEGPEWPGQGGGGGGGWWGGPPCQGGWQGPYGRGFHPGRRGGPPTPPGPPFRGGPRGMWPPPPGMLNPRGGRGFGFNPFPGRPFPQRGGMPWMMNPALKRKNFNQGGTKKKVAKHDKDKSKKKDSKVKMMEKTSKRLKYYCSLCKYSSSNEEEITKHLEGEEHEKVLAIVQKHFPDDKFVAPFLQANLFRKVKKTTAGRKAWEEANSAPFNFKDPLDGIELSDCMRKATVVQCLACKMFIPLARGPVISHMQSMMHIEAEQGYTEVSERHMVHVARSVVTSQKNAVYYERFKKGEDPFVDEDVGKDDDDDEAEAGHGDEGDESHMEEGGEEEEGGAATEEDGAAAGESGEHQQGGADGEEEVVKTEGPGDDEEVAEGFALEGFNEGDPGENGAEGASAMEGQDEGNE
ncbi:uncharacterized protein LOC116953133 isoform X2 [Petromyzon marinus]|uniref:uncharacterized protein LOC116953133 isoform X2 n=1 Tax=Petromyzon marinus TaxID=7757 RepID=UPI003F6F6373